MESLTALYQLAERDNIAIDFFELRSRDALSFMDLDGSCFIAINPPTFNSNCDEKMKLAHEIGHCVTGSFYNRYSPQDVRKKHENRANKWAIKKLIPKDELDGALAKGYTAVWELAEYFCVPEPFMNKAIEFYQQTPIGFENT